MKKSSMWFIGGSTLLAVAVIIAVRSPWAYRCVRKPSDLGHCLNYLRQIDAAKEEWALQNGKKDGDPVSASDIDPYIKGGFAAHSCLEGGRYIINRVGQSSRCTFSAHANIVIEQGNQTNANNASHMTSEPAP